MMINDDDDDLLMTEDEIETAFMLGETETARRAFQDLEKRVRGKQTSAKDALKLLDEWSFRNMDDTTRKMAGQTMGAVVQQAADADVPGLLELAARIAVERGETAGKFSDATKQFFKSTALRHPDVTIPRVDDVMKEAESRDFCREGLDEIFQNIKKGCASDDGEEFGHAVRELGSYVLSEGISKKKAFKFLNTVSFNFETDAEYFDAIVVDGVGRIARKVSDKEVPEVVKLLGRIVSERGKNFDALAGLEKILDRMAKEHPNVTIPSVVEILQEAKSPKSDTPQQAEDHVLDDVVQHDEQASEILTEEDAYAMTKEQRKACEDLENRVRNGQTSVEDALKVMEQVPFDAVDSDWVPLSGSIYSVLDAIAEQANDAEIKEVVRLYHRGVHVGANDDNTLYDLNTGLAKIAEAHPNVIPDIMKIMEEEASKAEFGRAAMSEANRLYGVIMEKGSWNDAGRAKNLLIHNVKTPDIPGVTAQVNAFDAIARGVAAKPDLVVGLPGAVLVAEDNLERWDSSFGKSKIKAIGALLHSQTEEEASLELLIREVDKHPELAGVALDTIEGEIAINYGVAWYSDSFVSPAIKALGVIAQKGNKDDTKRAMEMLNRGKHWDMAAYGLACDTVAQVVATKPEVAWTGWSIVGHDRFDKLNSEVSKSVTKALETIIENGTKDEAKCAMKTLGAKLAVGHAVIPDAYKALVKGVKRGVVADLDQIENSKAATELLNVALFAPLGDEQTFARTRRMIGQACIAHADLQVAEKAAQMLSSDCSTKLALAQDEKLAWVAVKTMEKGFEAHPELVKYAKEVGLEIYKQRPQDVSITGSVAGLLEKVMEKGSLKDAKQVISTMGVDFASDQRCEMSVEKGLYALGKGVEAHPELARNVLLATQVAQTSENHNEYSLKALYDTLGKVAKADPSLAIDVVDAVVEGMQNKANSKQSTEVARKVLEEVAKDNPQVVEYMQKATDKTANIEAYKQEYKAKKQAEKGGKDAKSSEVLSAMVKNAQRNR